MAKLVALDVAILLPAAVATRVIAYSAALSGEESRGLTLDAEHLPHVTLTQQFVREEELESAFSRIDEVLRTRGPLRVLITGAERSGHTVMLAVERTPELLDLHQQVMETLQGLERPEGGPHAFFDDDARIGDVLWVSGFRLKSSFGAFSPHITIGHGADAPAVEPFAFDATTVAACHLGRFCTCRRVLRSWTLRAASPTVA